MSKYPVSRFCPNCRSRKYRTTNPSGVIAFQKDRVCKRCKTRYTPQTPLWGAVVFLLLGLLLAVFGFGVIVLQAVHSEGRGSPPMFSAALGVLGLGCLVQGVRSFRGPQ